MAINYQLILDSIYEEVKPLLSKGKVADYIPELAKVPQQQFGMALDPNLFVYQNPYSSRRSNDN